MKYFLYFPVNSTLYKDCSVIIISLAGSSFYLWFQFWEDQHCLILNIILVKWIRYMAGACFLQSPSLASKKLAQTFSAHLLLPLSLMLYKHFYNKLRVGSSAVSYLAIPPSAADCCGYQRLGFGSKHELWGTQEKRLFF